MDGLDVPGLAQTWGGDMTEGVILLAILLPMALMIRDARHYPAVQMVLSPFWYFTFIFILSFPVRAALIHADLITLQVQPKKQDGLDFDPLLLSGALIFSLLLWFAILYGRRQTMPDVEIMAAGKDAGPTNHFPSPKRALFGLGLALLLAIGALVAIGDLTIFDFDGAAYQARRMGSGPAWLLPELFVYAAIAFVGLLIVRRDTQLRAQDYALLAVMVLLCLWISNSLFTRRLIAAFVLALFILMTVRQNRLWPLMLMVLFGTVFASGLLDFLRIFAFPLTGEFGDLNFHHFVSRAFERSVYSLMVMSSTFEGVDHVARLYEKASALQLLTGVDHGASWLFNAGAGLIPRSIWSAKPVVYGGMEQFQWLYPELFDGNFAQVSVPMSFVVDFSYAFGMPFALLVAFAFGRMLGTAERLIWDRASHPAQVALSIFIFIFVFNWVRGGTIILQSMAIFSLASAMLFGLRPALGAAMGLLGETIGLTGGRWWGTRRVFFYPHAYMRDRQLDTVRNWNKNTAVNADFAANHQGAQVSRGQATTTQRRPWKSVLPLVNIKARPKEAPEDATVYVWGGLIAKGPFITDIDNPYAFTAYNTLATKLYRPIVQSFLESPRCLQIRCLSEICLKGLRREYGEAVAQKAVVAYPKPPVVVDQPCEQNSERCRFLFVSTQFEIKGGEALLKAFARVVKKCPYAKLDLVSHLPEHLESLALATPNVKVHPADYTRAEISELYLSHADVLVHPTYFDSFGMIVLEALGHGLPVITTNVYALPEMVEDGVNGFVLPPPLSVWSGSRPSNLFSDVSKVQTQARVTDTTLFENALTQAMTAMAQDAEFRTRAGAASLKHARTRFMGAS